MEFDYFKFGKDLARQPHENKWSSKFEFFKDGEWVTNEEKNRNLHDAMMNYGDYTVNDFEKISPEEVYKIIKG